MAASLSLAAARLLSPALRHCPRPVLALSLRHEHAASRSGPTEHGASRSSLYEHVREGYSDKPELHMTELCADPEAAVVNVESRKGELRGDDVRQIVKLWQRLEDVRAEISSLEEQKRSISDAVKALVASTEKKALSTLPEYFAARQSGRDVRRRLSELAPEQSELEQQFYCRALKLPNTTHPDVPLGDESQARVLELVGHKPEFDFKPKGHVELGESLGLIRQRHLSHVSGHRSYYLRGGGARLQTALQNFTLDKLLKRGFIPLAVPDVLRSAVFEGCGMQPHAHRSQVYSLDPSRSPDLNLAGTGEVGIAGFFMDHAVNWKDPPCAVSSPTTDRTNPV
ncbi:serine--tRNA ligase, mitochondrial [Eucyclogobius newberryi]|uniref:serine--tRNA ligase, mitochondrial n=1 Tax=Eucyclogobius newberryi TaxID=166745 RepID=UPI003B599412